MLCLLHHIPTEETIRYALGCAVPKPVDPQWLSKAQTAQQQVLQSSQPRFCWRVFPSAPLLEQLPDPVRTSAAICPAAPIVSCWLPPWARRWMP